MPVSPYISTRYIFQFYYNTILFSTCQVNSGKKEKKYSFSLSLPPRNNLPKENAYAQLFLSKLDRAGVYY